MTFLKDINHPLFWGASALYLTACGVWALMLAGAWAASLQQPGKWRRIALSKKYADGIMKAMVRELVTVIGALGILAVAVLKSLSVQGAVDANVAALLGQVRGENTPPAVASGISIFATVPGKYRQTLRAYEEFLKSPLSPNVELIQELLPEDKGAFDHRLLGMSRHILAEKASSPKDPDRQESLLSGALSHYESALDALKRQGENGLDKPAAVEFRAALKSNVAGAYLSLAKLKGADSLQRKERLLQAKRALLDLKENHGNRPGMYLNLVSTLSLLGEFESALSVLKEVPEAARLSPPDKDYIWLLARDLDKMEELRPLAGHAEKILKKRWPRLVDDIFRKKGAKPI
jgi:tetratricopeptide (TPR) repeat protein